MKLLLGAFTFAIALLLANPAQASVWRCHVWEPSGGRDTHYAIFESTMAEAEITAKFLEHARQQGWPSNDAKCIAHDTLASAQAAIDELIGINTQWRYVGVSWTPERRDKKPAGLKTLTVNYEPGQSLDPGYAYATISLNYRFIACMGEVHVAYSLDRDSLETDDTYVLEDGARVPASGPPEVPSAIGFTAKVEGVRRSEYFRDVILPRGTTVRDGNVGPALGYGCFSGQTQKIGNVSEVIAGKHDAKELDSILNDALHLFEARLIEPRTLRNASIEGGSLKADRDQRRDEALEAREQARAEREAEYQAKVAEYERLQAERERQIAEIEAAKKQMAEQQAAQAARAQAVQEQYQQQMAAHQAQVDAANRAQAEYEAQLRAMGLPAPAPTMTYSAPAQAPPAPAPAPAQAPPPAASGASTASPAVTTRYYDCYGQIWNRSGSTRVLEAAFYGIVTSQEGKLDFPATDKALKLFIRNTSPDQGSDTENPGAWCHRYDSRMDAERSRERRIQRDSGLPGRRVSLELRM